MAESLYSLTHLVDGDETTAVRWLSEPTMGSLQKKAPTPKNSPFCIILLMVFSPPEIHPPEIGGLFFRRQGKVERRFSRTAMRYVKSWFLLDILIAPGPDTNGSILLHSWGVFVAVRCSFFMDCGGR